MLEVAVIGGGMAGLSAAWRLHRRGVDVALFEAGERVGGFVGTVTTQEGFVLEEGPSSIRGSRSTIRYLIRELGLDEAIQASNPAAKRRWIWARGRMHAVTDNPIAFLKSRLLSTRGKLRLLGEPFIRPRKDGAEEETLAELFARRLGREAVDAVLDPLVTGVLSGDPHRLGVDAFTGLRGVEARYGSFFNALRKRGLGGGGGGLYSLAGGLGRLPAAMAAALGERIHLDWTATRVVTEAEDRVVIEQADGDPIEARAVVVATSGRVASALLRHEAAAFLSEMPHPPIARVELGVRRADLTGDVAGFGVLCASSSPLPDGAGPILGIIYSSSVFDGRAPPDHHALAVMLGGLRDPGIAERSDESLADQAQGAVRALLGLRAEPVMRHVTRWSVGIPQYQPGHALRVEALRAALPPNVHLAGNYLDGVSLDSAVCSGLAAADSVGTADAT